ncbi:hypothetical protein BCR34DRAFT_596583 [Clohesyomyces aquaticus]|uniref:Cupredoxin n=1 Tax=Clohesyomyces aquaticus TaxID=1231657 RepID=A0A1Y2A684_9PLEO|nr:hypothetical protein BCR34DRAFT_596583 [Clohesyomyces aquaticus]
MLRTRSPLLTPLFALAILSVFASAQSSSATITAKATLSSSGASPSSTSSATNSSTSRGPQVFTVKVGAGSFNYDPANITDVRVGDTVTFEFYPPDHSVARAEFRSACVPYEYTGGGKTGFFSGTQNVSDFQHLTHWNLTINDTQPIFYYCTAPGSCLDHQMVGVINPNSTQTLEAQIKAAENAKFMVAPGQPIPKEASSSLAAPSSTPTSSAVPTPPPVHDSHHSLSGGVIAGIVVGAVAFLVICAALFFYIGRFKSLKEVVDRQEGTKNNTTPMTPGTEFGGNTPGTPNQRGQFSPQPEYGGHPPMYGQHHAAESHPSGWTSPPMHSPHMSMTPPPPQMAEALKPYVAHEMHSPPPTQQSFPHELEAPIKTPRG